MNYEVINAYANIIYELGQKNNCLKPYFLQFKKLVSYFKKDDALVSLISNMSISKQIRKQAIIEIFQKLFDKNIINLFQVMIDQENGMMLPSIAMQFLKLCDNHFGVIFGTVKSVYPLSPIQIQMLEHALKKQIGNKTKKVILDNEIVPSIIGGMSINIGTYCFDQTFNTQLKELKKMTLNELKAME